MSRKLNIAIDIDDTQMPYPRVANWKEAVEAIIRLQQTKD